jgi:type II secretory pathway component PulF
MFQSHHYRVSQSARTVRSLLAVGVPLLVAVDVAADAYSVRIGEVLAAWGAL